MALSDEQLVELRAELDNDPLTRGYAGLDDHGAQVDLNTDYRDYSNDISVESFEYIMRVSQKWDDYIKRAGDRNTNPAMAELMDVFNTRILNVDLRGHPNREAKEQNFNAYWSDLLDSCVAEGSLGQFAADAAKALCEVTVMRSWELFDQSVTTYEVTRARALP